MPKPEKKTVEVIATKEIYHGRVFDVTVATILEDGETYKREIVHHPGSAVIIPMFADGTVAFVRQYRHPAGRYLIEAPAGTLGPLERPEDGARRELEEEVGVRAGRLEKLSEFFISPGFLEEKMWVYLATNLTETKQKLDDDEYVEILRIPLLGALQMISNREIEDAKTIIGLMFTAQRLGLGSSDESFHAASNLKSDL